MSEGATEAVEQVVAPAAAPTGEPERKSWLERLKPVWWLRGVLAAWALVALADQLGFVREDWLKVVHAFASRWSLWTATMADWINLRLPWSFQLTPDEANVLAAIAIAWAPSVVGAATFLWQQPSLKDRRTAMILPCLFAASVFALLLPGDLKSNVLAALLFAFGFALSIALFLRRFMVTPPLSEWRTRAVPVFIYVIVAVVCWVALGSQSVTGLFLAVLAGRAVWVMNREYAKAMLVALTFLGTLEAVFWIPVVNSHLGHLVEALEAADANVQPAPIPER